MASLVLLVVLYFTLHGVSISYSSLSRDCSRLCVHKRSYDWVAIVGRGVYIPTTTTTTPVLLLLLLLLLHFSAAAAFASGGSGRSNSSSSTSNVRFPAYTHLVVLLSTIATHL